MKTLYVTVASVLLMSSVFVFASDVHTSLHAQYRTAAALETGDVNMARVMVLPRLKWRLDRRWRFEAKLRFEQAFSDTRLGMMETYSDVSKPLELASDTRVELDTMVLSYRQMNYKMTLGKQVYPLGVLDGLQITDRFDSQRYREAIFTDDRPDRLPRWGWFQTFQWQGGGLQILTAFDGTVSQPAQHRATFMPRAPRLRAGMQSFRLTQPSITYDLPDDPSIGGRWFLHSNTGDLSLLVLHGAQLEPLWRQEHQRLHLEYPSRTLYGITAQRSDKERVWRFEAAYIPSQKINTRTRYSVSEGDADRLLAGVGVDWRAAGFFFNTQLAVDYLYQPSAAPVRPVSDVLMTLKGHRTLLNDSIAASLEVIVSLSQGDGVLRPALKWQVSDQLATSVGIDWIWGDDNQLLGQFSEQSRLWFKLSLDL